MNDNTNRLNEVYDYLLYRHIVNGHDDFAKALGISRPNVTNMLRGKANVTDNTLRKINDAFPGIFNVTWLLTGDTPMFADQIQPIQHSAANMPDMSSLFNAALAAKDDAIESLKRELRTKDDLIQSLRDQLVAKDNLISEQKARLIDYRRVIDSKSDLSDYPFPVGAADGNLTRKSLKK